MPKTHIRKQLSITKMPPSRIVLRLSITEKATTRQERNTRRRPMSIPGRRTEAFEDGSPKSLNNRNSNRQRENQACGRHCVRPHAVSTYRSQIGWFPVFCFELSSFGVASLFVLPFSAPSTQPFEPVASECSMKIVEVNRERKQSDRKNRGESSRNVDGSDETSRRRLVR